MTDYYVVWHDVEDYEPRRTFEMIKVAPDKLTPEDRSAPSMGGLKTMYIRWHRRQFGQDQLYLVTYTHQQLKQAEIDTLIDRAIKFVQGEGEASEEPFLTSEAGRPQRLPGVHLEVYEGGTIYAIEVDDDLTHQVLLLSPEEAAQLRDLLNAQAEPDSTNPARNREARRLKGLALYTGHSLPAINRERYEQENALPVHYRLEVVQVTGGERRKMGEL